MHSVWITRGAGVSRPGPTHPSAAKIEATAPFFQRLGEDSHYDLPADRFRADRTINAAAAASNIGAYDNVRKPRSQNS